MTTANFTRADAINLLWNIKQLSARTGELGVIHFNLLLRDNHYRQEVLSKALQSDHHELRAAAEQMADVSWDGSLMDVNSHFNHPSMTYGQPQAPRLAKKKLGLYALLVILASTASMMLFSMLDAQVSVSRPITKNTYWTNDKTYTLKNIVYVQNGATLTIEAGTRILGKDHSALVITKSSKLLAQGTVDAPIVFTSAKPEGERQRGDWGGLVLLGSAEVNRPYTHIEGIPGDDTRGNFGGIDNTGSCGILEYARIEYAGFEVYQGNELNGLTLGGCGEGTIIRNVQVHRAFDDGIEIFGGRVDLKNIVITGARDDSLDWDMGWQGSVQNLIIQQYADAGDNALEGDNWNTNHDALPRSQPKFYNVTLIGSGTADIAQKGMTIRRGSAALFTNVLISGFYYEAFDFRDPGVKKLVARDLLGFRSTQISSIGSNLGTVFGQENGDADDDGGFSEQQHFLTQAYHNELTTLSPYRSDQLQLEHPDFRPDPNMLKARPSNLPQSDFLNEAAVYIGAVKPGEQNPWYEGWTEYSIN